MFTLDDRIRDRMHQPDFSLWRSNVEATRGCAKPIHLAGFSRTTDTATGRVLSHRAGPIMVPCGTRRAALCESCAYRYAGDAFYIVRAGLVPPPAETDRRLVGSAASGPRVFLTLTAPSFGPVHNRAVTPAGRVRPCTGCRDWHHADDPRIGTPIDPDAYDYHGAVLWQAHAGVLWHRFTIALRRQLAAAAGVPVRAFAGHARVAYAKVAEFQRRGLVHFHAVIRLDGPDGAPPPVWASLEVLTEAIQHAARLRIQPRHTDRTPILRPDGSPLVLAWGAQVDITPITSIQDGDGGVSESAVASYVAKYATKGTGATDTGVDRRIVSDRHIEHLHVSAHHRRMIQTCWQLGGLPAFEGLNLRLWAHMLGFRGHFLTKTRAYSTTFTAIRERRRNYQQVQAFTQLGVEAETVTVVNHWAFRGVGYRSDAEIELAHAIGERLRATRDHQGKEKTE